MLAFSDRPTVADWHILDRDGTQLMTEDRTTEAPDAEAATEDLDTGDDGVERDFLLQTFVDIVNRTNAEIGMTLTMGGMLVSGTMIGGKKYYDELYSTFSQNIEDEEILSFLKKIIDIPSAAYDYDLADERPINIAWVHLKDARFFGPDGNFIPKTGGTLWRGRISQVSGFNFGVFGADQGID